MIDIDKLIKVKQIKMLNNFMRIALFFVIFYVVAKFIVVNVNTNPLSAAIGIFTLVYFITKTYLGGNKDGSYF